MTTVGAVAEVWRYPVKSLVGEQLTTVDVDRRGIVGDRAWAVTDPDGKLGSGKTSRRFRRMDGLLQLSASLGRDDLVPVLTFPDGRRCSGDDPGVHALLSGHVGRPVQLRAERDVPHHDDGPLHLVTTASLSAAAAEHGGEVPVARLRPSLVLDTPDLDGLVEDTWVGRTLAIGPELVVRVRDVMPRCVMVDHPQVGLAADGRLLDTIGRLNGASLGVVGDVVQPGRVRVADRVVLQV